jgi:uncharacterized membrane protein (DUF2068 family)
MMTAGPGGVAGPFAHHYARRVSSPAQPRPLPGVRHERPARFVPRFHWELLVCGSSGHRLVGLDARRLRPEDALLAEDRDGVRWHRCLRCDSWLPVAEHGVGAVARTREFPPDRDEIELPLRGRPLRDRIILRLIAVNRALHFLVLALVSGAILLFSANRADLKHTVYKVITDLQGGVASDAHAKSGLFHEVDRLFSLQSSRLHLFAVVALVYAVVEGVEAVGLWYARRWAEYLTLIVTASLLPVEVYELAHHLTVFKAGAFVLNVAVVVYLLLAKRLFGLRGGVAAEHALREADVGWGALEASAPNPRPGPDTRESTIAHG